MKRKSISLAVMAFSVIAVVSSQGAILANWTFQTSVPTTSGSHQAEAGVFATTSFASGTTGGTYSNPAGWGSSESFSSTNWNVAEYFQFALNTVGYSGVTLSWQQMGSDTGPKDFELSYSTNGTSFTSFSSYTVTNDGWNGTITPAASVKSFDLSAITALNNQATVVFRLVNTSTVAINSVNPVGTTGTGRVDNFVVNAIPEPSAAILGGLGLLAILPRRRR